MNIDELTYRWIDGVMASDEDWDRIDSIISLRGWIALNKNTSRILVAEDKNGKLAGFICLQLLPHTEPLFVSPAYRATGLAETLADHMYDFMESVHARGWMVVAESEFAEKLCAERGMNRIASPVFVRVPKET